MFGRNGGVKSRVTDAASTVRGVVSDYGDPLAKDEKLRRRLVEVLTTGAAARERARRQMGVTGLARRLATDPVLRAQLNDLASQLRLVQRRVEKQHSHKVRNTILFVAGIGMVAAAAVPGVRKAVTSLFEGGHDEWQDGEWPSQQRDVDGAVESETVVTAVHVEPEGPAR
jgi:signal transduction protein with GAF and PtsI domain